MKKNHFLIIVIVLIFCVIFTIIFNKRNQSSTGEDINPILNANNDFDYKMINETNNLYNKQNYMISPLSIAYALSMVKEGSLGKTNTQVTDLLGNYDLGKGINIKDKIGIANLIFISNKYKNDVSKKYIKTLEKKYDSEVLFDDFNTPKAINDWVSKKTFNMIKNPVDQISPEFVLGLANAIAIDVEWKYKFECTNTKSEEFTTYDDNKIKVAMMSSSNDAYYIENNNAKGIIKDYAIYDKESGKVVYEENNKTVALEYIAILPNTSIDEYLKTFNNDELNNLLNTKKESNAKLDINIKLPKYTYDFDYKRFAEALTNLGMTDAFIPGVANFKSMIDSKSDIEVYISKAIHKSHIELSENGTKASAVTIFMFDKNSAMEPVEKQIINIEFNKPFIYIIKEKNKDNIWFFGTVYEPLRWEQNDSKNCKTE